MFNDHSLSLFEQTVRDTDEEFYATFPEARAALTRSDFSQQLYSCTDSSVNDTRQNISLQPSYNYGLPYQQPTRPQTSFDPVSHSAFALHNVTGSVDQIHSRNTPLQGRKRRAHRSSTPELTNGCELSVMRLDDFSKTSRDTGTQISYFHKNQRRAHSLSSRALIWDPVLSPPRSSIRLSPLPSKRQLEKKPPLACLFCRGRKIACGPPLPGSLNKTCNQCQRRSLPCEYPSESRRGMRKKKSSVVAEATAAEIE